MITAHEWSAAYVKAQQQAEQQKTAEPVVVTPQQARDMDDTFSLPRPSKEHA